MTTVTITDDAVATDVIGVEKLSRRFGRTQAADHISFTVPPGTICGFVGPNGAGKTTTIRMLMGLLKPTGGRARVLGLDPQRQGRTLRDQVAYVPENHHFYQWMKVAQVLEFGRRIFSRWDARECAELTDRLGLPRGRMVKELSRGETAKLALTLALSHSASLLILDEPTVGLDPLVRREFTDLILERAVNRGMTVFFSTHILSDLEQTAGRLILINKGRIVTADSVENLRGRFVKAGFLFRQPPDPSTPVPGALHVTRGFREWIALFPAHEGVCEKAAAALQAMDCMPQPVTLEEVFLELINQQAEGPCEG
jgi:ABC-2 type transport system ATP-binding protein